MLDKLLFRSAAALAALILLIATAGAVTIETVPIGNLGNSGELSGRGAGGFGPDRICGAVDYAYNIGKYEVTAGQYRDFLNDVAASDPHGLYNSSMDSAGAGCQITQNGTSGSFTYDFSGAPSGTASDWEDRPVNRVSWYDAAMFANWLTSGDIHAGAYDTSAGAKWGDSASKYMGITPHDSAAMDALVATYGKVWVIPTEDEWYKAAYHKNDGVTGNYFDYPTSSNTAPGYVNLSGNLTGTGTPFVEGGTDPGNYATFSPNSAYYGIGPDYFRTEAGEWENSDSPYGTFDQGGNVWEFNETRGCRGGSIMYSDGGLGLHASNRANNYPSPENSVIGFRVASIPEPGSITLLVCGLVSWLMWRRRAS